MITIQHVHDDQANEKREQPPMEPHIKIRLDKIDLLSDKHISIEYSLIYIHYKQWKRHF
jgi:hypothetical protein